MTKSNQKPTDINNYLNNLSRSEKDEINRLISIVKKEVSSAQLSISYDMPTFKYKDRPLIYFGAFKDHFSIFPTPQPIEDLINKLEPYQSGKGTLQYKLSKPFPEDLLIEVIQARINQIDKT